MTPRSVEWFFTKEFKKKKKEKNMFTATSHSTNEAGAGSDKNQTTRFQQNSVKRAVAFGREAVAARPPPPI